MKLDLPKPDVYVIAVSGGVDSMVLMDLAYKLSQKNDSYKFVVAHLDHGIRADSIKDRLLTETYAQKYDLDFKFKTLSLGSVSEQTARQERYKFLDSVARSSGAKYIVTAHHQDDLIETALINVIRGTGRKGLTALINNDRVLRPLVKYSKKDIKSYAKKNDITWREDSTNQSDAYMRNYIRHNILPKLDDSARLKLINVLNNLSEVNTQLDSLLIEILTSSSDGSLDRLWFNSLSNKVAKEVMAHWLRINGARSFKKSTLERLVVDAKIGKAGQSFPVQKSLALRVYKDRLALLRIER